MLLHSETRKYMQGRLYIDDIDAFAAWGVYLQDGSGKAVVQMPPMKAVDTTEWAEYDGLEADLDHKKRKKGVFPIVYAFLYAYQ